MFLSICLKFKKFSVTERFYLICNSLINNQNTILTYVTHHFGTRQEPGIKSLKNLQPKYDIIHPKVLENSTFLEGIFLNYCQVHFLLLHI